MSKENIFRKIWEKIKTTFRKFGNKVKTISLNVWYTVAAISIEIWNTIKPIAIKIGGAIKAFFVKAGKAVAAFFKKVWGVLKTGSIIAWNAVKKVSVKVWKALKLAYQKTSSAVKTALLVAGNAIKVAATKVWGAIKFVYNKLPKKKMLIAMLVVAVASSSFSLGYLLSRLAGVKPGGESMEIIPIMPTGAENIGPSVSGVLLSKDGAPIKNTTIELHSKIKRTITDENGYLYFHAAELGKHTVYAYDSSNIAIASCELEIVADKEAKNVTLSEENAAYKVEIPTGSILIELALVLEEGDNPTLTISGINAILKNGAVVSKDNVHNPETGKAIVTDIGNTVLDDGTVVLPDGSALLTDKIFSEFPGTILLPNSDIQKIIEELRTENGYMILEDGEIVTPGGHVVVIGKHLIYKNGDSVIFSGGEPELENDRVILADGTIIDKSDNTVILPSGTVVNIKNNEILHNDGTVINKETGIIKLPNDADGGSVKVISSKTEWTNDTPIDIFAGIDRLYPGVSGEYVFEVRNYREEAVVFAMTLTDTHETPIPFEIVLTDRYGREIHPAKVPLKPNSSMKYTIRWTWPYESGNDDYDSLIGSAENRSHTVIIQIRAKGVN